MKNAAVGLVVAQQATRVWPGVDSRSTAVLGPPPSVTELFLVLLLPRSVPGRSLGYGTAGRSEHYCSWLVPTDIQPRSMMPPSLTLALFVRLSLVHISHCRLWAKSTKDKRQPTNFSFKAEFIDTWLQSIGQFVRRSLCSSLSAVSAAQRSFDFLTDCTAHYVVDAVVSIRRHVPLLRDRTHAEIYKPIHTLLIVYANACYEHVYSQKADTA